MRLLTLVLLACLGLFATMGTVLAQENNEAASDNPAIQSIVDDARQSGATVVVIDPSTAARATAEASEEASALAQAVKVRFELAQTIKSIPQVPGAVSRAVQSARSDGSLAWMGSALLLTLITVVVAGAVSFLLRRQLGKVLDGLSRRSGTIPAYRVTYVLLRTLFAWLGDIVFLAAGIATVVLIVPTPGPARITAIAVVAAIGYYLVFRDLFVSLYLPKKPNERLLAIDDHTAHSMLRGILAITVYAAVLFGFGGWINALGVDEHIGDAIRILSSLLGAVLLIVYLLAFRNVIAGLIRGDVMKPGAWRRVLAAATVYLVCVYLAIASILNIVNMVLSDGFRIGPVIGPIIGAVVGLGLYGLLVVILARRFAAQEAVLRSELEAGATNEVEENAEAAQGEEAAGEADVAPTQPVTLWRIRWHKMWRKVAGVAAWIIGLTIAGWILFSDRPLIVNTAKELLGLALVLFATYALFQAVKTWIDGKLEEEAPAAGAGDNEDGMGPGATRLATLLPLLRNLLVAVVVAVGFMVVLAAMGVNVAPLFAGAGVIGLAVGFGAQTLIRDVFSGAFFLVDDAFRKGEYLDVGGVMGSVEKISVRSFQLRHHNGPLHTIPFGEIKQLTNFSRDWVIMKLPLRIAYGTDIERVRKLIKKLGVDMAADPEIGPLFVEPLKSQGVVEMEDSAMILRVKFMTKPGDQFVLRRHVFTRIGELFEKEGIRFAHRQVTVRIADEDDDMEPDERKKAAAAAAARTATDLAGQGA
ncbi:MAG: mechanosensitive ion channel family protein [Pseudomonadota bacterium]